MVSVAMDVFKMPATKFEGKSYDCLVAAVDRQSGWIVAVPSTIIGLTGAKIAKMMLTNHWEFLGSPL